MSWPYIVPAVAAAWVVLGVLVALAWSAIKAIYRAVSADDTPADTLEMELAANWRVIRAYDAVYDDLCEWENQALDSGFTSTALDIKRTRDLITERRDRVAAL